MENVDAVGNAVVASGLALIGVLVLVGTAGVAFMLELGILALFVAGVMMVRGLFGDSGAVGFFMWAAALALIFVFLMLRPLALVSGVATGLTLVGLAVTKKFDLW